VARAHCGQQMVVGPVAVTPPFAVPPLAVQPALVGVGAVVSSIFPGGASRPTSAQVLGTATLPELEQPTAALFAKPTEPPLHVVPVGRPQVQGLQPLVSVSLLYTTCFTEYGPLGHVWFPAW